MGFQSTRFRCGLRTAVLASLLALAAPPPVRGADFVVVNRTGGDMVLFRDAADSCRYPEDAFRFSNGESVHRVVPVYGYRAGGAELLLEVSLGGQPFIVLRQRVESGRYHEGLVMERGNLLAAFGEASDPAPGGLRAIAKDGGVRVVRSLKNKEWFVPDVRAADLAIGNRSIPWLLTWSGSGDLVVTELPDTSGRELGRWSLPGAPIGAVQLTDLTGDGGPDVVTLEPERCTVYPFEDGEVFGDPVETQFPRFSIQFIGTSRAVPGDFDGDGHVDLLLRSQRILFGDGTGSFPRTGEPRFGALAAAGDLDGDGALDVVSSRSIRLGWGTLDLFFGSFHGGLEQRVGTLDIPVGERQWIQDIHVADLDGDRALDVAVAHGDVSLFRGRGDGTFYPPEVLGADGRNADALQADFDGDFRPEIALLQRFPGRITVLRRERGLVGPSFGAAATLNTATDPASLHAADVNGDGAEDLLVNGADGSVQSFHGTGRATFFEGESQGGVGVVLGVADIDGDRFADALVIRAGAGVVDIHRNLGGLFLPAGALVAGREPVAAIASDFDRDGLQDLAVANRFDSSVYLFRGLGDLRFAEPVILLSGGGPSQIETADFDGNGWPDLVTRNLWTQDVSVFYQASQGAFSLERRLSALVAPIAMAVGDIGGRESAEIALMSESESYAIDVIWDAATFEGGGASDCGGFDNPGSPPLRLFISELEPVVFIRGDATRDFVLDVTDAVRSLEWLFLGVAVACVDALDTDDSGEIGLSDPLGLLQYLFRGGRAPAPPFPLPGLDPTVDGLARCGEYR